jgi:hypothetical protein
MPITRAVHTLFALSLFVLLFPFAATAQEVRVGSFEGNYAQFTAATPLTLIDWSRPATASGSVTTASVGWVHADTPCDNIFYVRFYVIPSNGLSTTMTAERGPFRAVNGINTVALNPPVQVTPETFIGVRRAAGAETCGSPYGTFTRTPSRALAAAENFQNGPLTSATPLGNFHLVAQASSGASVRVATLPAVGSVTGVGGSFFRTSLTLSNPGADTLKGTLKLRVAGRAGSDSDPSLDFTIAPNGTLNYDDVLAAMSQSGLGSLDIYTTASFTPIANARVFNDAGAAGTSGFSEESVPADAPYLSTSTIFIPADLTNYRLNVGVRTYAAADFIATVYDASGAQVGSTQKSYPADYFEQVTASVFMNGRPLPPGGKIVVLAFQKPFFLYGAVTDNRTNDPSVRVGLD